MVLALELEMEFDLLQGLELERVVAAVHSTVGPQSFVEG
jgi:hypothetical protein